MLRLTVCGRVLVFVLALARLTGGEDLVISSPSLELTHITLDFDFGPGLSLLW